MALQMTTTAAEATQAVGAALGTLVDPGDVILLSGDLGAGKTQFVKGLARGLGVSEPVTSPTFNIMLVHVGRVPLYHVDLYRLERPEQLEDVDYAGTVEAGGVTAVEWGDRFEEARASGTLSISIGIIGDEERLISVDALGARGEELLAAWADACADLSDVSLDGKHAT